MLLASPYVPAATRREQLIGAMLGKAPIPMKRLVRLYIKLCDEYASGQPDVPLAESEIIRVTIAMAILSTSLSALADIEDIERHVRFRVGPPLSIGGAPATWYLH